jgi:hypothetical protein
MVRLEPKDRVRYRVQHPHQQPSFKGGATVITISGDRQAVTVDLDGDGGRATYPYEVLELETPDPSREVKPTSVRRIPYGARR